MDKAVDKVCVNAWVQEQLRTPAQGDFTNWLQMDKTDMPQPLKTSVSAVAKKQVMEDPFPLTEADEDAETKRIPEEIVTPLRLSDLPARPAFMEEHTVTPAERGTITHHVLALTDLSALREE